MPILIIALCIVLAVFCSQEGMRAPLADQNLDYISRILYEYNVFDEFFVIMLIVTVFIFRGFQSRPPSQIALLGTAVYFGGRVALSEHMPLVSAPLSFHAMSQTGLVLVAAYLTVQIAHRCAAVDDLFRTLFVPGAARFDYDREAATEKANGTLQYCRRHSHAAGVIMLKPDVPADKAVFAEIAKRMLTEAARSAVTLKVASRVAHGLRRTDILVNCGEKGEIAVICPEADSFRLQAMITRITDDVSASLGIPVRTGSAQFPEDALTYDDLLRVASAQIDQEAGAVLPGGSTDNYRRANP